MIAQHTKKIKDKAFDLGFSLVGITSAKPLVKSGNFLKSWLKNEYNGQLDYMNNNVDKRINPSLLSENVKSIIVVALNYFQPYIESPFKISNYALGNDYHYLIKEKLQLLLAYINNEILPVNGRAFVDSAPILEKELARKAGIGWIGKNSMLITKKYGSYVFLGELFVDVELEFDKPMEKEYCGNCSECLTACPTNAIIAPKIIDTRKCISYLNIEYKGEFSEKTDLHGWLFGCDECQIVCPWNTKAIITNEIQLSSNYEMFNKINREQWKQMTKGEFKKRFKNSPLYRRKISGILKNLEIIP